MAIYGRRGSGGWLRRGGKLVRAPRPNIVPAVPPVVVVAQPPVVLQPPGTSPSADLLAARAFLAPVTMGGNVERGTMLWNGRVTPAAIAGWKAKGVNLLRFFPPFKRETGFPDQNSMGTWYDACARSNGQGVRAVLALQDIVSEAGLNHADTFRFVEACGAEIKRRGLDPLWTAIGVANEYGDGSEAGFRDARERCLSILRAALPAHVLCTAASGWNSHTRLVDGSMFVSSDKRRLYEWHNYLGTKADSYATMLAGWTAAAAAVQAWADAQGVVPWNGEFNFGPPTGGDVAVGAAGDAYSRFPDQILAAARGMPRMRGTFWAMCTDGSHWRGNVSAADASLRPEVAAAFQTADAEIRASAWWQDEQDGLPSDTTPALPPIPPDPGTVARFAMATARPGVPAVNRQFDLYSVNCDWAGTYGHATQGFAGDRWQTIWLRADGYHGSWEPAEGPVHKVWRKGPDGQDGRTFVFECDPNPAGIPSGDPCLLYLQAYEGGRDPASQWNVAGFNVPLGQKLQVLRTTQGAMWDPNTRRRVEIDFGVPVPMLGPRDGPTGGVAGPSIAVLKWDNATQSMQPSGSVPALRFKHLRFFKNASGALRSHLASRVSTTRDAAYPAGAFTMLGGSQMIPTFRCWSREFAEFGSIAQDLYKQEHEGMAAVLGDLPPSRLAVELENEPAWPWRDGAHGLGLRTFLADVMMPVARRAWGPQRTLCVKGGGHGSLDGLLGFHDQTGSWRTEDAFDLRAPADGPWDLHCHNYDGQSHMPGIGANGGVGLIRFATTAECEWYASQMRAVVDRLGYGGGGMSELGANTFEWWNYSQKVDDTERGRRLGRMQTALAKRGMYAFLWGFTGDGYACAGVPSYEARWGGTSVSRVDGRDLCALYDGVRTFGARAGLIT